MIRPSLRSQLLFVSFVVGTTALAHADLHVPAQFPTIQAAVTAAAPGTKIVVAPGVYEEQVVIAFKNLTLVGQPGAVIRAPVVMAQTLLPASERRAIVGIFGADVVVRGFDIDGARRGNTNPDFNGVVYAGAGGKIQNCRVHGVRTEPLSPGGLSAPLRAFNFVAFGTPVVQLDVIDNVFEDNFDGILVTGDDGEPNLLRVRTRIRGNHVRGSGPTDLFAQIGIGLYIGVDGQVVNNLVTGFMSTDPANGLAVGILGGSADSPGLEMPPIEYIGNVLLQNQVGIATIFSRRARVIGNYVQGSSYVGIGVSGDDNRVALNTVRDCGIGIGLAGQESAVLGTATNTKVILNHVSGCAAPIQQETGVTGTVLLWNDID